MKRSILCITFFIIFLTPIYSIDNTTDVQTTNKAMEFTIGGGFNHSVLWGMKSFTNRFAVYYPDKQYPENDFITSPIPMAQELLFTLPISFCIYLNKYYGIGITNSFGVSLILLGGYELRNIALINKLKIMNKIGNFELKKFLIIETGISLISYLELAGNEFESLYFDLSYYKYYNTFNTVFYTGPCLFLGYQRIYKKELGFIIGGIFEAAFNYFQYPVYDTPYYYSSQPKLEYIYKQLNCIITVGIECRINYSYLKKIKDN